MTVPPGSVCTRLSDLGRLRQPVALAASPDCAERPDCAEGLENVYGVKLSKVEPLGSGTPDTKAALVRGQVQLAQVATTDAQVGTDLVLLADDRHMLDAANVVPLVNSAWLSHHRRARAALDRLADVLTTEDLRDADRARQRRSRPRHAPSPAPTWARRGSPEIPIVQVRSGPAASGPRI